MKSDIDLHVHSRFSGDSDADPEELILRAIDLGLDGIAITEHYSYGASGPVDRFKEVYGDRIMIFRGVELATHEGHCLVFGVDTDKAGLNDASMQEVVAVVNAKGGAVIPSHPYRRGHGMGDVVKDLDGLCALEGYNGYNMAAYNERAVTVAVSLNLPFTGGSDAHYSDEVGNCYTEFAGNVTHDNFLDMLKRGNYRGVDTRKISRSRDMTWQF